MFDKIAILKDLVLFLWSRKLWWLIPMILVMLAIGLLILVVGSSPLAPIIYPLF